MEIWVGTEQYNGSLCSDYQAVLYTNLPNGNMNGIQFIDLAHNGQIYLNIRKFLFFKFNYKLSLKYSEISV